MTVHQNCSTSNDQTTESCRLNSTIAELESSKLETLDLKHGLSPQDLGNFKQIFHLFEPHIFYE